MKVVRSAAEWEALVKEYELVGGSVREFCARRGLKTGALYRRLRGDRGGGVEFIELRSGSTAMYELSVNGVVLKIASSESAKRIAELIQALRC
jgi:hypothetical protein